MATAMSAYAPALVSDEEMKETFYVCLDETLSKIPKEDKIILLGDFNTRVGRDHHLGHYWQGRHWKHQLQLSSATQQMCSG